MSDFHALSAITRYHRSKGYATTSAFHQAADSACLARVGTTTGNRGGRRWTDHEVALFKEAVKKFGVNSNIVIAREVGTRTAKQCGNFKKRFLVKNPIWAQFTEAPPLASQPSPRTPTACSSGNTGSTPPIKRSDGISTIPRGFCHLKRHSISYTWGINA